MLRREQIHLTATGDTVNVASPLEALTRSFDATIVASDALIAAVQIGIWIARGDQPSAQRK